MRRPSAWDERNRSSSSSLRSPLQVLLGHRIAKGDAAEGAEAFFGHTGQELDDLASDIAVDVLVVGFVFMRDENSGPGVDRLTEHLAQAFERTGLERERFAIAIDATMNDDRVLSLHGWDSHDGKYAAASWRFATCLVPGSKQVPMSEFGLVSQTLLAPPPPPKRASPLSDSASRRGPSCSPARAPRRPV